MASGGRAPRHRSNEILQPGRTHCVFSASYQKQYRRRKTRFCTDLGSVEVEKAVALELCGMPSRPALYQDKDILSKFPWFEKLPAIFNQAVARPSGVLGVNYNRLAYLLSYQVGRFLRHDETAEETVRLIEDGAKKLMRENE